MVQPLSNLEIVDKEICSALREDRPIKVVSIGPELWFGFLLHLDLPQSSKELRTLESINGSDIVKRYLHRTFRSRFYFSEFPFLIKSNKYIQGVRVTLYPPIPIP